MNDNIFRKKSIDKVSSPEQLNDYIRVANPGVWLVLGALIALLIGVCVWGVLGSLNTTLAVVGNADNGVLTCYVSREGYERLTEDVSVLVNEKEYENATVSKAPVKVENNVSEYLAYLGNFGAEEWVYTVKVKTDLPNGDYEAEIMLESVSPISFVLN